jgi:hypothetical protein
VYIHDVGELRSIAREFCSKFGAMCYEGWMPDKVVLLGYTWVENFYYVDPAKCAESYECLDTLFKMHREVLKLALEGKYSVNVEKRLMRKALRRLREVKKTNHKVSERGVP